MFSNCSAVAFNFRLCYIYCFSSIHSVSAHTVYMAVDCATGVTVVAWAPFSFISMCRTSICVNCRPLRWIPVQYTADQRNVTWFPIQSLHACAALTTVSDAVDGRPRFVALDSPEGASSHHAPMFCAIMRRTRGIKVIMYQSADF